MGSRQRPLQPLLAAHFFSGVASATPQPLRAAHQLKPPALPGDTYFYECLTAPLNIRENGDRLLGLVERRQAELEKAEAELRERLQHNRS